MSTRTAVTALAALALSTGLVACDGPGGDDVVARAGDHTFTVDEAASLLGERDARLPNNEDLVAALTDLWVDYTLLAQASLEDPTLSELDVEAIVESRLDQEMLMEFRDAVVDPDTAFTEEELRREFEDGPLVELQARHILLNFPEEATDAQRDSVFQRARDLRQRALEGEDFAALAREFSDDAGSAEDGGDLGTFGRGRMVPAFEEAAFALEPGEISEPVESPFGVHVILVEDRIVPDFEEHRDQFAGQLRDRRMAVAESTYVAGIEAEADVRISEEAHDEVRRIAARPGSRLDDADQELVRFDGGAVTAAEVRTFLQDRSASDRDQIEQASAEQLDNVLRSMARRELLVAAARDSGAAPAEGRRDEIRDEIVEQVRGAAERLGLTEIESAEGESEQDAVERAVRQLLQRVVGGDQGVVPLGSLAYTLRAEYGAEIDQDAFPRVVEAVDAGEAGTEGPAGAPPQGAPAPEGAESPGAAPAPQGPPGEDGAPEADGDMSAPDGGSAAPDGGS